MGVHSGSLLMNATARLADALDRLATVLSRLDGPSGDGWVAIAGMDGRIIGFETAAQAGATLWGKEMRIVGDPIAAELVGELRRTAGEVRRGMSRSSQILRVLRRVKPFGDDEQVRVALARVSTWLRDDGHRPGLGEFRRLVWSLH